MAAYHESRIRALSEYFAFCDPDAPRVIRIGYASDNGWRSETIETVEAVEGSFSGGHFPRQMPHVRLLPDDVPGPVHDSEDDSMEEIRATPEIANQTPVEVAVIERDSIIGRSPQNVIRLHKKSGSFSPVSWEHIRFICIEGVWAVQDLGSESGTVVNGVYIQGTIPSSSSGSSSKRSFSQASFQSMHHSFSARASSSQGSDLVFSQEQEKEQTPPSQLTLRPNEINEIQIGGYRLTITPYLQVASELPFDYVDPRYDEWQNLFGSPESFWHCNHCRKDATRVAVAKFIPVICELRACKQDDLEDFSSRRERLRPLDHKDKCLERILAISDGNDRSEGPFVASLLYGTARSLEQMTAENEVFEPCDIRYMLKELLTALSLHGIDHGSISKSTVFIDHGGQVCLRGFMRSAQSRRLGKDVQDLFEVFRSITPQNSDHKFKRYLNEHFDSPEHARDKFPSPDAKFDEICWLREDYIHRKRSKRIPSLEYVAIGQLCDVLLLENPSQAATYIERLSDLHRLRRLDVDFDHCILYRLQEALGAEFCMPSSGLRTVRVPVLNLIGYGTFLECSRLRLWADRQSVEVFDRKYVKYPFLDVVSDDENLNGSYAQGKDVAEIVRCLKLPEDLFSGLRCQEQGVAPRPKLLFYLKDLLVSVIKHHNNKISWVTSGTGKPSIQRSDFAQLVNREHKYPHIFRTVPRKQLDELKSTIVHEPPPPPEEVP